jgi:hypothetical protein
VQATSPGASNGVASPVHAKSASDHGGAVSAVNGAGHERHADGVCMQHAVKLLRRQQNHGGEQLVKAYLSTVAAFQASAARHAALVEARDCTATAQGRLAAFCHRIVLASLQSCQDNGTKQGLHEWSAVENSPVLCAALGALASQQAGSQAKWAQDMMPALCGLMRCSDSAVREAVADILDGVVWPQLQGAL